MGVAAVVRYSQEEIRALASRLAARTDSILSIQPAASSDLLAAANILRTIDRPVEVEEDGTGRRLGPGYDPLSGLCPGASRGWDGGGPCRQARQPDKGAIADR